MGVYVKDEFMPKECFGCFIEETCFYAPNNILDSRHKNCPLVEIPESSGRIAIIDFDTALLELNNLFNDCVKRKIQPNNSDFEMALNVLTIIEEER